MTHEPPDPSAQSTATAFGVPPGHEKEECLDSHELHDSVAQTLYGITLSASRVLTLLERSEIEQVHTIVSEMLRLANDSQTALRALVHDLRSDESYQLQRGLTGTLVSHAACFEASEGCQVRLSLANEPDLAPSTKATLARIAREALHNIAKHAQATYVDLVLEVGPTDVTLLVADDGRGFDPSRGGSEGTACLPGPRPRIGRGRRCGRW